MIVLNLGLYNGQSFAQTSITLDRPELTLMKNEYTDGKLWLLISTKEMMDSECELILDTLSIKRPTKDIPGKIM